MNRNYFTFLALVPFLMLSSEHEKEHFHDVQVYCGRNLGVIMALLCNEESVNKNFEDTGIMYEDLPPPTLSVQKTMDVQWLYCPEPEEFEEDRANKTIAGECCDKPCSISELRSHC